MIQGHGGNVAALAAQLGCRPEAIVDMSSNINPLGTLPGMTDHLRERIERIRMLPEVDAKSAVEALAVLLDIDAARVLAGGGTTQFIYAACAALATKRPLIVGPTYADYADGCRVHGLEPDFFLADAAAAFQVDVTRLSDAVAGHDLVFVCNPNNPTGRMLRRDELEGLCRTHPTTVFLVDESYLPFAPDGDAATLTNCRLDNLVVLWSVSKIFGMPGLRAGFLVAEPPQTERFRRLMQPWCVNSLAQEAVLFLGAQPQAARAFIARTRDYLDREGKRFRERLAGCGLTVYPSVTSYFLIRLPDGLTATTVCERLAAHRFLIRNCANFHGLDERFIRIALKDEATNTAVADHLRTAVLAGPET
ncbi:MAG: aminotransferase class I/II-fold pyridoxal phosphate-dependent enzyme [Desulfobulbus sp.]|jgi:threonine-phosphate decarboxylase|nr:aminotransferase class I/II-fold pyridoxal phosphate-dependent enzyme [Desulfobulbus sp.]